MFKRKTLNNDLAALDGRKFSLDKIMIIASFIILAIIAIVPVASIIVNALFVDGKLALDSFFKVLLNKENIGANVEYNHHCILGNNFRYYHGLVLCMVTWT